MRYHCIARCRGPVDVFEVHSGRLARLPRQLRWRIHCQSQTDIEFHRTWITLSQATRDCAPFCLVHGFINLIETAHCEEKLVQFIDFYGSVQHFIQSEVVDRTMTLHDVLAFRMRADETAAVDLDLIVLTNHAELDGIPEQAAEFFEHACICNRPADAAIVLEKVGEHPVGMHGNVTEHIVKDVGLWRVFERFPAAQPRGGWKEARGKHLKKRGCGKESADWGRTPTGARREAGADGGEVGKTILSEPYDLKAIKVFLCCMLLKLRQHTTHE